MKKSVVLILHFSFWILIGLLGYVIQGYLFWNFKPNIVGTAERIFVISIIELVSAIVFYIFYFSAPFFLKRQKRLYYLIASILIIAITYGLKSKYINNNSTYLLEVLSTFAPALILIFFAFVFRTIIELWKDKLLKTELEKEKLFTQLELLKSKINPHFLFNSLNNIDILIEENPKIASDYLSKLSDILRFVLYETKDDELFIGQEIEQIKNYIELQKIRTNNTRFINFNIKGEINKQKIAPMLFIPFIENAFKYCKNKNIENGINVEFEIHSDYVKMHCKNYFESNQIEVTKNEGLGIETIKQRLNLLYPKNYELVIDKSEHWFNVTLSINLKNDN